MRTVPSPRLTDFAPYLAHAPTTTLWQREEAGKRKEAGSADYIEELHFDFLYRTAQGPSKISKRPGTTVSRNESGVPGACLFAALASGRSEKEEVIRT